MTMIRRLVETYEEVEVPEGYKVCWRCEGKGKLSLYDKGYHSVVHSPRLAALETCFLCQGRGMVPGEGYD